MNLLAQKRNVGVINKKLGWLDDNVIFKKKVKQNMQLFKQVRQRFGSIKNVIHISLGLVTDFLQNIIHLMFDVGHQVDVSHD